MTIGAEIDARAEIGPVLLEAVAGLKASVDNVATILDQIRAREELYARMGPVDVQLREGGTSGASGNLVFEVGGPKLGRLWILRRVVVGSQLWSQTSTATANLYVAASRPIPGLGALTDMVDQLSLPGIRTYSSRIVVLHAPMKLYCEIASPAANTGYTLGGAAEDLPDVPAPMRAEV